jgi:ABC-type sugar transport system permease subunit
VETIKVTPGADRAERLLRDPDEFFRSVHAEAREIAQMTERSRMPAWADVGFSVAGLALGVAVGIAAALASDEDSAIGRALFSVALVVPTVLSVAGLALAADYRRHRRRGCR